MPITYRLPFTDDLNQRDTICVESYLTFLCGVFWQAKCAFIPQQNDWRLVHTLYALEIVSKSHANEHIETLFAVSEMFSLFMCQIIGMPAILWVISGRRKNVNKGNHFITNYTGIHANRSISHSLFVLDVAWFEWVQNDKSAPSSVVIHNFYTSNYFVMYKFKAFFLCNCWYINKVQSIHKASKTLTYFSHSINNHLQLHRMQRKVCIRSRTISTQVNALIILSGTSSR